MEAPDVEESTGVQEDLVDAAETSKLCLFVKGLNFKTDEEGLRNHFAKCGRVVSATVVKKVRIHFLLHFFVNISHLDFKANGSKI